MKGPGNGAWISGRGSNPPCPTVQVMAVSQKIAAVERRKARLPCARAGGRLRKGAQVTRAVSALRLPQGGNEKTRASPGKRTGKSGDPRIRCAEPKRHVCRTLRKWH